MKTSLFRPLLVAAAALALSACGKPAADESRLVVAATAVPHAEILEVVKPLLAKEGVTLDVRVFNDYVQPNDQLVQKQVDANYFQTEPYLDAYNRDRKTTLVTVAGVHIEPFGAYSHRVKSLDELADGADVVIPNDPSNNSRALILLDKAGSSSSRTRPTPCPPSATSSRTRSSSSSASWIRRCCRGCSIRSIWR